MLPRPPPVVNFIAGCCSVATKITPLSRSDPWCFESALLASASTSTVPAVGILCSPARKQAPPFVQAKTCTVVSAALHTPLAFLPATEQVFSLAAGEEAAD